MPKNLPHTPFLSFCPFLHLFYPFNLNFSFSFCLFFLFCHIFFFFLFSLLIFLPKEASSGNSTLVGWVGGRVFSCIWYTPTVYWQVSRRRPTIIDQCRTVTHLYLVSVYFMWLQMVDHFSLYSSKYFSFFSPSIY